MNELNLFTRVIKHLKTILTHKYYVFLEFRKYGLYWRGLTHDLSKFWLTEFNNSVKYYREGEVTIIPMPFLDCIEYICHYYVAGKAYKGKDYTYYDELLWFRNKIKPNGKLHMAMHPYTAEFIHSVIYDLASGMYKINMDELQSRYDEILNSDIVPIRVRYSDPINVEYFNRILEPWLVFKIQKK